MLQIEIAKKDLTKVGEEISQELAGKMVKDFNDANSGQMVATMIGKNIIEKILDQPGCVGISFYNAINETGRQTLVYVGIDAAGQIITEYTTVNTEGELAKEKGIIADRGIPPPPGSGSGWGWF